MFSPKLVQKKVLTPMLRCCNELLACIRRFQVVTFVGPNPFPRSRSLHSLQGLPADMAEIGIYKFQQVLLKKSDPIIKQDDSMIVQNTIFSATAGSVERVLYGHGELRSQLIPQQVN